jgi:host cell surface-exposed lipoprotein
MSEYSHLTGGPAAPTTTPEWQPPTPPKRKKRGRKIAGAVITLGLASFITIGVISQNSGSSASAGGPSSTIQTPGPGEQYTPGEGVTPATQAPSTENPAMDGDPTNDPNYDPSNSGSSVTQWEPTVSQQQALESAQSYLDMGGFSKGSLIEQLEYEEFSSADARWAARHAHANWNEQAVESAKSYLDMGGFSRGSLIEQLEYEKFTLAQATYAANQVGL